MFCANLIFKINIFQYKKIALTLRITLLRWIFCSPSGPRIKTPHESGTPLQSPLARNRTIKAPPSNIPHNWQLTFLRKPSCCAILYSETNQNWSIWLHGKIEGGTSDVPFFVRFFPGHHRNSRTWFLELSLGKTRFRLTFLTSLIKANILQPARLRWKSPLPLPPFLNFVIFRYSIVSRFYR